MSRGRGLRVALVALVIAAGAVVVAIVLGVATGRTRAYRIPTPAMAPTLEVGDRILVTGFGWPFESRPRRGDVVVFHPPVGALGRGCGMSSQPADGHPCSKPTKGPDEISFVKRVVALPGDRVAVRGNRAYVNGRAVDEPYVRTKPCAELCNLPKAVTVPPRHYYMLGDNRGASDDSRDWGPVQEEWLVGRKALRYWPP